LLIIFDLDDTLIDTSGCIVPYKLEDALLQMVKAGLVVSNFSEALDMLKRLNETSESTKQTLEEFLELHDGDKKYLDVGVKEVYENISLDIPVFAIDYAMDVLNDLRASHQLALVTVGIFDQQIGKMKKAGIDTSLFSKIVVAKERNKKPHYQAVVDELGFSSQQVIVCGDRIVIDLIPAKELGFKTVHFRWGRGLNSMGSINDVDYSISELRELKEIIKNVSVE
jgi:putative hydrolase of the HAD superfamily